MDEKVAQLILDELFSSLEVLETQTAAVLQFLKEKAGSSDEQLAPYLEQAGKASSIKRRAARVRIDYLISEITNRPQKAVERDATQGEKKSPEPTVEKLQEKAHEKDGEDQRGDQRKKTEGETEAKTEENSKGEERAKEHAAAAAGRNENQQEKRTAGPAVDKQKKIKPTQPDATDQKTGEKNKKESGQKPTEKSPTSK
ncbi:MAG TPA: hypothetical protein VK514_04780 [Candidatus Acidoferrum sp.]|nr:hypothetical protein [Candidatus Acidoferrum sp.]